MIQPVNAFAPKVLFRSDTADVTKEAVKKQTRKRLALLNAGGISLVLGAATTAIARSNTSSWHHAGYFGIGTTLACLMFLVPGFLKKTGINNQCEDVFLKEKKFITEAGEITAAAKNTTKNTIKSMSKI